MKLEAESGRILMRGMIGDYEGCIGANDVMDLLGEQSGDIRIELDSEGGCVRDGLSIYNQIRRYEKGRVTIQIDALAASIATVIACAADVTLMNPNSQFMVHNAWTIAVGSASDFRGLADALDMMDMQIADTYAEKSGGTREEWKALMDGETYLNASQAMELGIVDEIVALPERRAAAQVRPAEVPAPVALSPFAYANSVANSTKRRRLSIRK